MKSHNESTLRKVAREIRRRLRVRSGGSRRTSFESSSPAVGAGSSRISYSEPRDTAGRPDRGEPSYLPASKTSVGAGMMPSAQESRPGDNDRQFRGSRRNNS